MDKWSERGTSHGVWEQMKALGPALDKAGEAAEANPAVHAGLERLRGLLTLVGKRLAAIDPSFLSPATLDAISNAFSGALSDVTAFTEDLAEARIDAANVHADGILPHLGQLGIPLGADDLIALRDAGVAHRQALEAGLKTANQRLKGISTTEGLLVAKLDKLSGEFEKAQLKVVELEGEIKKAFETAEQDRATKAADTVKTAVSKLETDSAGAQERLAELSREISAERDRVTKVVSEFQSQFSTAQEARGREFTEAQGGRQQKFVDLQADFTKQLTESSAALTKHIEAASQLHNEQVASIRKQFQETAEQVLARVRDHEKEVKTLVGVIGDLGVTSGHVKVANYARRATWFWNGIALSALFGLVWFAYRAFLPLVQQKEFSWESFASRLVLTAAIGVLAAFSASQGDKYLDIERRNRKLALELAAIGPYLAPLPVEKQEAFRLALGDRTFGREEIGRRRSDKSPTSALELLLSAKDLQTLIETLTKKS